MERAKLKAAWRSHYLRHLKHHAPTVAANLAGVGRSVVNREKRRDPDFARECDEIQKSRPGTTRLNLQG